MSEKVVLVSPLLPSQEAFEEAGFIIENNAVSSYVIATLPENWTTRKIPELFGDMKVVYDERGRERATIFDAEPTFSAIRAKNGSKLVRWYNVMAINRRDNHEDGNYEIVFCEPVSTSPSQNKARINILFSGGRTHEHPEYDPEQDTYSCDDPAVKACIEYADKTYPNWRDYKANWDN